MIPSPRFFPEPEEAGRFWDTMPEKHRRAIFFSLPMHQRQAALVHALSLSPHSAISPTTLSWIEPLSPTSPTAAIHLATNTCAAPVLAEANLFIASCHESWPWLLAAIPECYRGPLGICRALGFTGLCRIPGGAYLCINNKHVALRLLIHGQETRRLPGDVSPTMLS